MEYNSLLTQAIARASSERHHVPNHERIDGAKPALRNEVEGLLVDRRVCLHHICRHPNSNLQTVMRIGGNEKKSRKSGLHYEESSTVCIGEAHLASNVEVDSGSHQFCVGALIISTPLRRRDHSHVHTGEFHL